MTASYNGRKTLGEAISGLTESLDETGKGLEAMRNHAAAALTALATVRSCMEGSSGLALELSAAIELSAELGFNIGAALEGIELSLDLQADLSAEASLNAAIQATINARVALEAQLSAALEFKANLVAGLNASLDLALEADLAINANIQAALDLSLRIDRCTATLNAVMTQLGVAIAEALQALDIYRNQMSALANGGVYCFEFDGLSQDFGTDMDTAIAASELPNNAEVSGPVLLVFNSNAATRGALDDAFGL